eukprot:TRINITY_DN2657_c0_g1_i1.p1 TRINITY_DN2657_c0_g1~~TRINITY_DN2657_c0_g1_i1.p1  ORF type:complete len:365 (+),score=63.34 TRINITY_DN2657_c0_g1_i1:125-1219(+)
MCEPGVCRQGTLITPSVFNSDGFAPETQVAGVAAETQNNLQIFAFEASLHMARVGRLVAAALLAAAATAGDRKIIIFVAPPCAGKGTQSPNIQKAYGIPHLSTGDMLRAAVKARTRIGLKVSSLMEQGKLVDDDIVNQVVAERIQEPDCGKGILLDGYPRNIPQAEFLDGELAKTGDKVTDVVSINVSLKGLKARIRNRWVSPSGDSYNVKFIGGVRPKSLPPGAKPVCDPNDMANCNMRDDHTGEPLYRRSDDSVKTLLVRLKEYREQTAPLLDHYHSVVKIVNGEQPEPAVWHEMHAALEGHSQQFRGLEDLASFASDDAAEHSPLDFSAGFTVCVLIPVALLALYSRRQGQKDSYERLLDA